MERNIFSEYELKKAFMRLHKGLWLREKDYFCGVLNNSLLVTKIA
jgi:hypothetical protein